MSMIDYEIDAGILPKLLKVLELVQFTHYKKGKKMKAFLEAYSKVQQCQLSSVRSMRKHCYDLVTKCIASHRYEEAAKLFWILCQEKKLFEYPLLKVGIIILLNLEISDKNDCFLNFFRSMLSFSYLSKKEVLLEFLMCALKCEFPDVLRQVKELRSRKVMSKVRKHDEIASILDSYIVLLEWCKCLSGDMNFSQSQTNNEIVKPKKYNENSDIFILKLVKMMELYDKQNEVENELLNYVESNPDNVNALIYICTYLYHYHQESDKLVYYLEILAERCISDVRTLWLIEIWEKRGVSLLKILNYCFMFLDYPTNGKNIKAWKVLWKNLTKAQQELTEYDYKNILSLWDSRKRSWAWMYFNPRHLQSMQSNDKLIAYKVAFLLVLVDGKKYIKKVSKHHPDVLELAKSLRN